MLDEIQIRQRYDDYLREVRQEQLYQQLKVNPSNRLKGMLVGLGDLLIILAIIVLMAFLLVACGPLTRSEGAAEAGIPKITLKAVEYALEAPDQLEASLDSITLDNRTRPK